MRKVITILIAAFVLMLAACSPAKSIIGTWKSQSTVLGVVTETSYVFNEDGSGKICNIVDIPFTYAIEGNKLTLTTNVIGLDISTKEYEFSIKGGILKLDSESEHIELTKGK